MKNQLKKHFKSSFALRGFVLGMVLLFSGNHLRAQAADLAVWTAEQLAGGAVGWISGSAMEEAFGSPVSLSSASIDAIGAELSNTLSQSYLEEIETLFNIFYKSYAAYDNTSFEEGSDGAILQMNRLSDLLTQGFDLTTRLEDLMRLDECRSSSSPDCPTPYATTEPTVMTTYMLAQTMFLQVLIEQDTKAHSDITQSFVSTESLRSYNYIHEFVIAVENLRFPYPSVTSSDKKTVFFSCCLLPGGSWGVCSEATYFSFDRWFDNTVCADELYVTFDSEAEAQAKVDEIAPQIAQNRLDLILGEGFEEVLKAWKDISEDFGTKSMFPVARK